MNTVLPIGASLGEGFAMWKTYAAQFNDIPVSGLMAATCAGVLDWMDIAAYAAPFPDERHQAGVRRFPQLVPVEPGMVGAEYCIKAREFWSSKWTGPSFMAIGMQDPVLGKPVMEELRSVIKNCPPALEVESAGHFVQEWGEDVAKAALASFGL